MRIAFTWRVQMSWAWETTYDTFMTLLIKSLKDLGVSGTIEKITSGLAEIVGHSEAQLDLLNNPGGGVQIRFEHCFAWTKNY